MSRSRGNHAICWGSAFFLALTLTIAVSVVAAQPAYADENQTINVTLGHFAPFSDSEDRAKLDVTIDGQQAADDLGYLEQMQNLTLEAGTHSIIVEPTEWAAGAFTDTFDVPVLDGGSLVDPGVLLAVNGGTSGIPLNVVAVAVEQAPPATGALIRFMQLAPFALEGESEYTVCNPDGTTFAEMTMIKYGVWGEYTEVSAGSYPLYLAGSHDLGCAGSPLSPIITIVVADGSVGDFIAVGTNAPPPWITQPPFPISLKLLTVQTQASAGAVALNPTAFLPQMVQR